MSVDVMWGDLDDSIRRLKEYVGSIDNAKEVKLLREEVRELRDERDYLDSRVDALERGDSE